MLNGFAPAPWEPLPVRVGEPSYVQTEFTMLEDHHESYDALSFVRTMLHDLGAGGEPWARGRPDKVWAPCLETSVKEPCSGFGGTGGEDVGGSTG